MVYDSGGIVGIESGSNNNRGSKWIVVTVVQRAQILY